MIDDLNPRHVMIRRLGYYATGLAIGLVALGFIQMGRKAQLERMAAIEQQEAALRAAAAAAEAAARATPKAPPTPAGVQPTPSPVAPVK